MNPGDRVTTKNGPGTLKRYVIDRRWAYNRPDVIHWAAVKLDGNTEETLFHPATIKEEPVPMTEPEPTPTDEPQPQPEPTPEPEPEPDEDDDDDDSKATRRTITIEDEELVGQAKLIKWP